MNRSRRLLSGWLALGAAGFLLAPWYALQDTIFGLGWLRDYFGKDNAPAIVQALRLGRPWLLPIGALLALGFLLAVRRWPRRLRADAAIAVGASGFLYLLGARVRHRRARLRLRLARRLARPRRGQPIRHGRRGNARRNRVRDGLFS